MENNKAMLSTTLLANTPSTSGTTFEATAGEGNRFPTPDFYGVVYPSGVYPTFDNAEIVKVTAVSTDNFTVTRAQLGTSAQDVQSGWRFSHTLITDDFPNLPSSSTDNAIVRFDGTTGRGLQNSSVTVNDSGNLSASGTITGSNLSGTNTGDQDLSSYPTLTSASTLTNKSLVDSSTYIIDDSDNTKKAQFQASGITTATTRTITFPNSSGTMYVTGGTDVSVADGGTGRSTSTTAYGLIAAGTTATGAHQTISPGTSGQFLKSAGSAALASFASINVSDVSGAAASGANSDITSLTGLTTALPLTEGGTGSTTASGARTNLGLGTMATKDGTGFQTLTVASSAPSSPATGDIWIDTNDTGVWQTWTPSWTNFTPGSATITARYSQVGKTVNFSLKVKLNGSTMGTIPRFTLPVPAVAGSGDDEGYHITQSVRILDAGIAQWLGVCKFQNGSTTTAEIYLNLASGTYGALGNITSTSPMTWGNSDCIFIYGMYEAA